MQPRPWQLLILATVAVGCFAALLVWQRAFPSGQALGAAAADERETAGHRRRPTDAPTPVHVPDSRLGRPGSAPSPSPERWDTTRRTSGRVSMPDEPTHPHLATDSAPTAETLAALRRQLAEAAPGDRAQLLTRIGTVLAALEDGDFADVQSVLDDLTDPRDRRTVLLTYLSELAKHAPESAVQFAMQLPNEMHIDSTRGDSVDFSRNMALATVFRSWAQVDAPAAAAWATQMEDVALRQQALSTIASTWANSDLPAALDWARELADTGSSTLPLDLIARTWAARDIGAAVAYCQRLPEGDLRDLFLQAVIPPWIVTDRQAALDALAAMPAGARRQSATLQAVWRWASTDPAGAASWATQNLDASTLSAALNSIVRAWVTKDTSAALDFVARLPDEATRIQLLTAAATDLANTDPAMAISLLRQVPASGTRDSATETVAINWARRDPAAAAAWAEQFPAGTQRQTVLSDVALQWTRKDPESAANWLRALPDDAARYSAIVGFAVGRVPASDAATLAQWRSLMKQPNLTREAVSQWLEQSSLPTAIRREAARLL